MLPPESLQRRTLSLLFLAQVLGGVGVAVGMSVGALLAAEMVSVGVSGLAQSAVVLGSALLAVPAARIVRLAGRRPSLTTLYLIAALGSVLVILAVRLDSAALLFPGYFLFGGATAASLQARYAAVDLAPKALYGRHLSFVVWATTIGGVIGPNLGAVAARTLEPYGVTPFAAPFVFSLGFFLLVSLVLFALMRPDPIAVLRAAAASAAGAAGAAEGSRDQVSNKSLPNSATGGEIGNKSLPTSTQGVPIGSEAPSPSSTGIGAALAAVRANRDASLGVLATAIGHVVMVAVMAMTPVHIRGAGHSSADTIRIVGIVISVHIAGMYAFAPVMGWLSDRLGRPRVILGGVTLLVAACATAGTAGHDSTQLGVGLFLLGLGWSATMVAGSALVAASTVPEMKPAVQGLSDLVMGVAAAGAGALSGVVVGSLGYPSLTLAAAVVTAPLAFGALQRPRTTSIPASS